MKVRSWYKSIIFAFFISTQSLGNYVDDQSEERRRKFNASCPESSYVEHTKNLNELFSNYQKVSHVPANEAQKKINH